jgi:AraC-like DNA-binding protein
MPNEAAKEFDFPNVYLHVDGASLLSGTATWTNRKLSAHYWRLYWNLNPNAAIHLRDKTVSLDPSTIALIPPFSAFDKSSKGPVDHFHIHFIAGPPFHTIRDTLFSFPITTDIRSACREVIQLLTTMDYRDPWIISRLSFIVFWALHKIPLEAVKKTPVDARIEKVFLLMEQNIHRPLSNDLLAHELNMNTNAFIRLFKKETSVSPHQFYIDKRIEKACVLLHSTTQSIEEIASATGFADRFHFSRVFAEIAGSGPSAYRKNKS